MKTNQEGTIIETIVTVLLIIFAVYLGFLVKDWKYLGNPRLREEEKMDEVMHVAWARSINRVEINEEARL
jgi:hypothetical protein